VAILVHIVDRTNLSFDRNWRRHAPSSAASPDANSTASSIRRSLNMTHVMLLPTP
jgi:hypothetical protein